MCRCGGWRIDCGGGGGGGFLSYQDQESGPEGSSLRLGSAVPVPVQVPKVQCSAV